MWSAEAALAKRMAVASGLEFNSLGRIRALLMGSNSSGRLPIEISLGIAEV